MLNSELLKEAIADAKAVRNMALMNAKSVLEENFSKQVREMFADKLREDADEVAEEADESVDEVSAPNNVAKSGGEANPGATKDVSKGEPKKVSDSATNWKVVKAGKGPDDVPEGPKTIEETAEEGVDEAGLTSEDLEEIIGELESEVSAEEGTLEGEEEPVAPAPAPVVDPAAAPVVDPAMAAAAPAPCPAPAPVVPGAPMAPAAPVDPMAAPVAPVAPVVPPAPGEDEEEVNLEELIKQLSEEVEDEEGEKDEKEDCDEAVENGVPKNVAGQDGYKSPNVYPKQTSDGDIEAGGKNHNIDGKGNIGDGDVKGLQKENAQLKKEISEFRKTVEYLRGSLQENQLLNSKLFYVTKLYKNHNLTEGQKKKIVDTFDLSKSVREVKLTYAALKESLNFGARDKQPNKTVQSITEGLASKAVPSTKPSKEIIEEGTVDETKARFQKLANIRAKAK